MALDFELKSRFFTCTPPSQFSKWWVVDLWISVAVMFVLVGLRAQKDGIGIQQRDVVLHKSHVKGVPYQVPCAATPHGYIMVYLQIVRPVLPLWLSSGYRSKTMRYHIWRDEHP